jgi:hypothetical protein
MGERADGEVAQAGEPLGQQAQDHALAGAGVAGDEREAPLADVTLLDAPMRQQKTSILAVVASASDGKSATKGFHLRPYRARSFLVMCASPPRPARARAARDTRGASPSPRSRP